MKGVVLTETGESLVMPMPMKLIDILVDSPGVSHSPGFVKIFDFDKADEENKYQNAGVAMSTPTKYPSKRRPEAVATQTQAAARAPTLMRANSVLKSLELEDQVSRHINVSADPRPSSSRAFTDDNLLARVLGSCETMANTFNFKTGTPTQNETDVGGSVGVHAKLIRTPEAG
jgi:hypothetical protein